MPSDTPLDAVNGENDATPVVAGAQVGEATRGLYKLDARGCLSWADPALAKLLGHASVDELLAARHYFRADLYQDSGHAEWLERWVHQHDELRNAEAVILRADGRRRVVSENLRILRNDRREKQGEEGELVDLGDWSAIEGAWTRTQYRYRTLLEQSQDGVFVAREGRYTYVNVPYARMLGYEPHEMIGRRVEPVFAPDQRAFYNHLWRGRQGKHWEEAVYETRLLHKEGHAVPVSVNAGPLPVLGEDAALGTVRDLSDQHANRELSEMAEARYRAVVRHASVGVYRSTRAGELLGANQPLVDMLGYDSMADFKSSVRHIEDVYVKPDRREALLARLEKEGEIRDVELRLYRRGGREAWFLETSRLVRDDPDYPVCYEGILVDITERKLAERKLRYMASHDPLTQLPNRELTRERLRVMLETARGKCMAHGAVLRVDLNVLKRINDSLGYAQGDRLLKEAARRLYEAVGEAGSVSRHEGDAFVVLAPTIMKARMAENLAEAIEQVFVEPITVAGHNIQVQTAIGIVMCEPQSDNVEAVLRDADAAMMACKRRIGRDSGHLLFDNAIRVAAVSRLQLETDMRAGLERGEFEMHYQPIYRMDDSKLVGFEALARWRHPQKGLLEPAAFIGVAEQTGLILQLGRATLVPVLRDCARWQAHADNIFVAFNLSDRQFHTPGLVPTIALELGRAGLASRLFHIEVTESVFVADPVAARKIIKQLHELGVQLYLDDFGTGYSGLSYLNELSFDALKIDRGFIEGLVRDKRTRAIVRHIITLAHDLDIGVVAEGIESEEEAAVLRGLNCALGQGYLYGAAISAGEVDKMLETSR